MPCLPCRGIKPLHILCSACEGIREVVPDTDVNEPRTPDAAKNGGVRDSLDDTGEDMCYSRWHIVTVCREVHMARGSMGFEAFDVSLFRHWITFEPQRP